MHKWHSSITTTLLLGLILGLILPIGIASWYTMKVYKEKLYDDFQNNCLVTTKNIANIMSEPIYSFSPNNGSLALEVTKADTKVVKVEVYDTLNDMEFIEFYIPQRDVGTLFEYKERVFNKDNEEIGWVKIVFNDFKLSQEIKDKEVIFQTIFGLTFLAMMLIMPPLLYLKLILPLKKLLRQSEDFRKNKLENPFQWDGKDELNILGQSLELARVSIVDLIDTLQEKNDELEFLYITDRLTGLYNRHKLDSVFTYEINRAKRYACTFGIIIIDIDYFKNINDTYGHQEGDKVLIELAKILKNDTRKTDTVGRLGGEEFLIIVPNTDEKSVKNLAETLRAKIENHTFDVAKTRTASFGVTLFTDNDSVDTMIARADKALYTAKKQGRNQVVYL
jgi:diguanylate cyclase (GGDEF)-like protein